MKRCLLIAAGWLALSSATAATPLSALIDRTIASGGDATLPPNLSIVLGLASHGHATPVKQLMVREGKTVHMFNVDANHRHEIVLAIADEDAKVVTAYLMSPAGRLRKAVTYRNGEQPAAIPRAHAAAGFAAERDAWTRSDRPFAH